MIRISRSLNTESLDGRPVGPLMGSLKDPDAGVFYVVTYPNFYGLQASSSYVSSLRLTPHQAPERRPATSRARRGHSAQAVAPGNA